jgi:hypothetical protein
MEAGKFVKVTHLGFKIIAALPLSQVVVLMGILPKMEYNNSVNLNGCRGQIAEFIGRGKQHVAAQISNLKSNGILIPGEERGCYFVNPFLASRGDGRMALKMQAKMKEGGPWYNETFTLWLTQQ